MKTMSTVLIAVALVARALSAHGQLPVPGPQPKPVPRPDDTIRRDGGTITGTIRLVDCNAIPADVRVSAGGISVQPTPLEDNAFVWRFSIGGLPAGTHTVTPALTGSRCRGGTWTPVSRRATITGTIGATPGVTFEYRGRRNVVRIGAALVASLIEGAFRGTVIHLNNYTGTSHSHSGRDSWHVPNDSFVQLSPAMGGTVTNFTLLEISQGPLRYYVNDFNLTRVSASVDRDAFVVSFLFEDRGPVEIRGRCSNTTAAVDIACTAGSDSTAPDFNISNARLDARLSPARAALGGLTFGSTRVTFNASVAGGGVGDFFETRVRREIKAAVEREVSAIVDQPSVRGAVAAALAPELARAGVGPIISVRIDGGDLVIESFPR